MGAHLSLIGDETAECADISHQLLRLAKSLNALGVLASVAKQLRDAVSI